MTTITSNRRSQLRRRATAKASKTTKVLSPLSGIVLATALSFGSLPQSDAQQAGLPFNLPFELPSQTPDTQAKLPVDLPALKIPDVQDPAAHTPASNNALHYEVADQVLASYMRTGAGEEAFQQLNKTSLIESLEDYDPGDFYHTLPTEVQGQPGQVIKSAPSKFSLLIPGVDWTGSHAERVAYVYTDIHGVKRPVTGTIFESNQPYLGKGERPLLVVAPGTQGNGNFCSPGKQMDLGIQYEALQVGAALLRGWNVALTDLPGMGVPNKQHTYMIREEQANATLDMARAAINHSAKISSTAPIAISGYSQGGGASAAALEMAATYAPELNVKGGYAGGVPADLKMTAEQIDGGPLVGALGYAINGLLDVHPEVRPLVEKRLNERGHFLLKETESECMVESLIRHAYERTEDLTKSGKPITKLLNEEPVKSIVDEQLIGNRAPKVPVYVGHGVNDDIIPVEGSATMARKWCEAGTPVYFRNYNLPQAGPLLDHVTPMLTHLVPAFNWLQTVFNGEQPQTTACGDIGPTVSVNQAYVDSITAAAGGLSTAPVSDAARRSS